MLPSLSVGGLERVQVTIANALSKKGHDVTVMTYMEGDALARELNANVRFIYKKRKPFKLMRKIPYIRYKFFDDGLWETRASAKKLYRYYVGKERYDVEIGFFRGMAIKVISGSTNRDSVKLAWVHSDFEYAGGFKNNFKNMAEVYSAYKKMDKVVCVSKKAEESFKKIIGDTGNLSVIYNLQPIEDIQGKSLLAPETAVKKAGFHIVHVGRLIDRVKGQTRLIDCVVKLRGEGLDISLVLVGDGEDRDKIAEHIRSNGANSYITMVGNQSNPYPYMKEADLLVCSSRFEGFPLFVAESMIVGTPVLSTDCSGSTEMLDNGKYGMIVENSEKGIYEGLKELYFDRDKLRVLREKTFERIDYFDEDRVLGQIEDLFKVNKNA